MATESNKALRPHEEKRGGYSGGKPLSEMGPPPPVPSAHVRRAKPQTAKETSPQRSE
jgi:hypothetical protein